MPPARAASAGRDARIKANANPLRATALPCAVECRSPVNGKNCNCTYEPCPRKGVCCECLADHLRSRELPACCFPADAERTYDRSIEKFRECAGS